ncbi:MAG: bifunctional diaminohydroxyphosphoribosylaminopyrimidine deaminase/5-amino-6-(5-phosphoribosylamino)uracil reductase RibD [Proteobacteria bacterium]|nr:bifunctional diaminohydroxyphosphoribosylaminopyrimidine deaminase/5-amino-6-(5-phosphoribosylamino)uracil reductase RibD [Pseudomonadota bacterium]
MPCPEEKQTFMKTAIRLAKKAAGAVSPNPLVGAVLVKDNGIIATGYHHFYGGPHAEVYALKSAGNKARGADLYINLEPCCHQGKTPPCADALIMAGIRRVFIGMKDPNPLVSGKGIRKLAEAGIEVEVGILEHECRQLNEVFVKYVQHKIPFVFLKIAASLDGKIATSRGDSKWITGDISRRFVHRLRSEVDAVLVGIGTVLSDDPLLTSRQYKGAHKNPCRVVVDSTLRIPLTSNLLNTAPEVKTIIATSQNAPQKRAEAVERRGAEILRISSTGSGVDLKKLVKLLWARGIASLLIEGGSEISASALHDGIVDKLLFFYAPKIIGNKNAFSMVGGIGAHTISDAIIIRDVTYKKMGGDLLVAGYIDRN